MFLTRFLLCDIMHVIREKERMCGPDGFLDSARYQHSYKVRMDKKKASKSASPSGGYKPVHRSRSALTVVDMQNQHEEGKKEFHKRIKVIEVGICYLYNILRV